MADLKEANNDDILVDVTSIKDGGEVDDSALLDTALGMGEDDESIKDGVDNDLDGEISLLDQDDVKEQIPLEDPVYITNNLQ